jgi:hypothetical protein
VNALAYCRPTSVGPGDEIAIHVSAPGGTATVEIIRDGAEPECVWRETAVRVAEHAVPDDAPEVGCRWPATLTLRAGTDWASGCHLVRVTPAGADAPATPTAFFVVRAPRPARDRILFVLATNTWNAYNDVGGRNYYTGAVTASFDRPLAAGMLAKPEARGTRLTFAHDYFDGVRTHGLSMWHGMAGWATWERPFAVWAERAGYTVDVATNADLERVPALLDGYRLVLSVGHDEYWSWGMRDAVESFVARGGNVAFFSGNTCYWQARFEDDALVCWKHRFREDPLFEVDRRRTTTIWSDPIVGRPETSLTGVTFTRGGYSRIAASVPNGGGYEVHRPEHWAFEGTGLRAGDLLGASELVVAYECDGCELAMADGRPVPTGRDGCPPGFEVLASAPATPFDRESTPLPLAPGADYELEFHAKRLLGDDSPASCERLRHGHAVLGSYTRGGTVFTTGCTDWAHGLGDPAVERVTRNVLDRLGRGA